MTWIFVNAFDYEVLAMLDGGPELPWGAATMASLGFLKGCGYVEVRHEPGATAIRYLITERGREALAQHRSSNQPKDS